jgi:hypothetical protein
MLPVRFPILHSHILIIIGVLLLGAIAPLAAFDIGSGARSNAPFAQGEFSPSYTADEACHNLGVVYVTGTEDEPSYQKHIPRWVAACNRATGPACLATRSVIGDDLKKPVPEGLTCR